MVRHPRRIRGISLVELMVGITLGLLVTSALLTLFARSSTQGQNLARATMHIENGRYLTEMMGEELRLAGFWGEVPLLGATYSTPDPCATTPSGFSGSPLTVPTAIQGYDSSTTPTCLSGRNRRAGTDALVLRRVATTTQSVSSLSSSNTQFYLQASFCTSDASNMPLAFAKTTGGLPLHQKNCSATSPGRPYISRLFYVADCNDCTGSGDGSPTLKRLDLVGDELVETALVDGIETLRLEYGFDTNNDGAPDEWRTGLAVSGASASWANVMAVKLHVVVRSVERVTGPTTAGAQTFQLGNAGTFSSTADGRVRKVYSVTTRLINPSGLREVQ